MTKFFEISEGGQTVRGCFGSKKFRIITLATAVFLLALLLFFGGFFAGRNSVFHPTAEPEVTSDWPLPVDHLKWVGFCPKKTGVCPPSYNETPPLLLISLDGFRPDYLERGYTPTLTSIAKCGTRAPFMYPVFPSKTFPNHYSQVTGLNPASHGIIDNTMYDPFLKKIFKLGTAEALKSYWWNGEPIWVTAVKQGKKTGTYFWPGSDVEIRGVNSTYFKKYSSKIAFEKRVKTILEWLDYPIQNRPVFLTLYFNEPDHAAHVHGINSQEVNIALKKVDDMITLLFTGLQERNILDCVNVIVTSDHGMADTSCDKLFALNEYINISSVFSQGGTFGRLKPKGPANKTYEKNLVSSLQCKSDHVRVSLKQQLPIRFHYASNARIEPIFIDIDSGWMIGNYNAGPNNPFCAGGNHGYDNLFPDMRALFMAIGPSFKENYTAKPFINTELYEMMAELINITSLPNNGTKGSLHHLLKDPQSLPDQVQKEPPPTLKVSVTEENYDKIKYISDCECEKKERQVDASETHTRHLPFGVPHKSEDGETLRMLYNRDYVSGLDLKYRLPLWTSFTISGNVDESSVEACWTADARLPKEETFKCSDYNDFTVTSNEILLQPLFPPNFSSENSSHEAFLITNGVPKYRSHVLILADSFTKMLSTWAKKEQSLNVIMGPAFDIWATGVYPGVEAILKLHNTYGPLVVPSHYFSIITWCKTKIADVNDCSPSELDTVGFLLPNIPLAYNCELPTNMIAKHAARVVDIEVLTGMSFFTGLPMYDAIRLRTSMPEKQMT